MANLIPYRIRTAASDIGAQLQAWRKLRGLTAQQVAERAGVSRAALRRVESGEGAVNFQTVLRVAQVLGVLDLLVQATDPYETPFGRARADQILPERVRHKALK